MNTKTKQFSIKKTVQRLVLCLLLCFPVTAIAAYYQGSRYYYNILSTKNYSAESQAMYNALVAKADALHQDFTTTFPNDVYWVMNPMDFGFRKTNGNGQYYSLEVLDAMDSALAAFFQDNVQYFMLSSNAGLDNNYDFLIYFQKVEQGAPTYDYRLPADRRAHMDMVDSVFAKYRKLTENASSKYEIARYIHDKIVSDWDYAGHSTAYGTHDLIGPMGYSQNGIVCEAYAKIFAFMANNLGVPANFVPGEMIATNGFPAGGHAWNIALMDDGNYYFLDATWTDNQRADFDIGNFRNPLDYTWFLLGHDNGLFERYHYAGVGSMLTVYERPANTGGPDYDYKNLYPYKFLGDIPANRTSEFDLGTYNLPANGVLDIQPKYYDQSLVCGVDYEVEVEKPLKLGKNRVWFYGKGNYRGLDFGVVNLVNQAQTVNISVSLPATTYAYTGQPIEPAPTVKNGSVTLIEGQDYLVSYQDNLNRGTAKVIVTGLGIYAGRYETQFQIYVPSVWTNISAAGFDALWPNVSNCLVVITRAGDPPRFVNYELTKIRNAADYYGVPVYYIENVDASITNYAFYNEFMSKIPRLVSLDSSPVLAVIGTPSYYGAEASSKNVNGGSEYGIVSEDIVRDMIRKYINLNAITGTPAVDKSQSLQAYTNNGKLHVSGLSVGMSLSVYSLTGLVHQSAATSDQLEVALPARGVYIVKSGNNTIILSW
ncbi:MAG: hypothetical protein LBG77_07460 [Dysgonamonadaceae bacterium]|jgi:hypothetical protein|nr:hypothetical protein [Dysgonamonadaceae bacterium]